MDIFDIDDDRYGHDIVEEALHQYQRYNDWEILEREFRNKIDDAREWSEEEIHECVSYLRSLFERMAKESSGVHLDNNYWFSTQIGHLRFWEHYKKTMKKQNWSQERIDSLTRQCTEIVNLLPNPKIRSTNQDLRKFCKKGLVYGNVQAGKTASIAGVISMYASAGCQLIIVLSGITNNLRWQTQTRLVRDLKIQDEIKWYLLTPEKDRIGKNHPYPQALLSGNAVSIGVFKKNPYALRSLLSWLAKTADKSIWEKNQVLIIDDECDQYSPNVILRDEDDNTEYSHSSINGLIVSLIKQFPRVCYVGYTATPFANVLNETPGSESLYPEDFIYALDKNEQYYGAEKIFGNGENADEEKLDVVNIVNDEEFKGLKNFTAEDLPSSLKYSIAYFIIATACKYTRGINGYSTMLIHIDLRTDVHAYIEKLVLRYISVLKEKLRMHDKSILSSFKNIWDAEKDRNPSDLIKRLFPASNENDYIIPDFDILLPDILNVIDDRNLDIVVDNSTRPAEQRLNYEDNNPHAIIVIGGNTLSRGLTLEGLLVSYFVRSSSTYDTLLQMGRWFGYRPHYEDLPRIWMTVDLLNNFRFLCGVEDEIRDEISNYDFDITPKDFAMRIKTHPRMRITRALAMQAAQVNMINFAGTYTETYNLERWDESIINGNINATRKFLASIVQLPEYHNNAWIYRNCDVSNILTYINEYAFCESNKNCKPESLKEYIGKAMEKGHLNSWNVVVKTLQDKNATDTIMLSNKIKCHPVSRARLADGQDSNIAHFSDFREPRDLMVDVDFESWSKVKNAPVEKQMHIRKDYYECMGQEVPGLLIIYPIDKNSRPRSNNAQNMALEAKQHLIGLLFEFPQIEDKELFQYMSIPLKAELEVYEEEV